jgi:hypothetical protein
VEEKRSNPGCGYRHPDPETLGATRGDEKADDEERKRAQGIDRLAEPSGADLLAVDFSPNSQHPFPLDEAAGWLLPIKGPGRHGRC